MKLPEVALKVEQLIRIDDLVLLLILDAKTNKWVVFFG